MMFIMGGGGGGEGGKDGRRGGGRHSLHDIVSLQGNNINHMTRNEVIHI